MLKISRFIRGEGLIPRPFRAGLLISCLFLVFCTAGFVFPAENRYALVIGNSNYRDNTIPNLSNPINDASDVASALKDLGYTVTLKTNQNLRDMIGIIRDFVSDLRRSSDSEGFFWFAGHGLSIRGVHYMLPVDVDPSDDSIIARGSFSVDELMEEIEAARNRTNLVVIDACRNNVLPGSRSVGGRGLAVLSQDDYRIKGNKIIYSTMAGKTAADGVPGSRNSPFAQAFLSKIRSPEIFDDVFLDIANETMRLTRGEQEPYSMGAFAVKSYTLNQQASSQGPVAQAAVNPATAPETQVETARVNPVSPAYDTGNSIFILDGKKVLSLSVAPLFYGSTFSGDGFGLGTNFTFFEKYRNYGEMFFAPNSFYVSLDLFSDSHSIKPSLDLGYTLKDGNEVFSGGILGVGALYKIRLEKSQRLIANFGFSFELFLGTAELFTDDAPNPKEAVSTYETEFDAGIGLHGGLSFRFTRLISLDFGLAWKYAFKSRDPKVPVNYYDPYTLAYIYTEEEPFAKGVHLYTFGGALGVSFWWPR